LINYKSNPDWETKVREITGGAGVDYIVEVGGAQTLHQSLKAAKIGGTILVIGILSGIESSISALPI